MSYIQIGAVTTGSTAVKATQQVLKNLGYRGADGKPVVVDGAFGNNTAFAQKTFAEDCRLEALNLALSGGGSSRAGLNSTGASLTRAGSPANIDEFQKMLVSMVSRGQSSNVDAFMSMKVVGPGGSTNSVPKPAAPPSAPPAPLEDKFAKLKKYAPIVGAGVLGLGALMLLMRKT